MPRLLRVHFASIGHPDARLAPLTLDLRAQSRGGGGTDSVLWLRNGGGKSTILNLFYSLFRTNRSDFLGASAEGKARHLEDYVKAEDLAFVVSEWDVQPDAAGSLFGAPAPHRRVVGQVLAWRDRQRSSDHTRLRRRCFSLKLGPGLDLEDLPIQGLSADPSLTFEGFKDWMDALRERRPELEIYADEPGRRWKEHLERIGLDPELFGYQLRMNAREGSADEVFRFRTPEEFISFFLTVAFDAAEADQVSENLEHFRDKLQRRPDFLREQAFLADVWPGLAELSAAVARREGLEQTERLCLDDLGGLLAALVSRDRQMGVEQEAARVSAEAAAEEARKASNDAARLTRWANGLERRAVELTVEEARRALGEAEALRDAAQAREEIGAAAVARDGVHALEVERAAKDEALRALHQALEPLRAEAVAAGTALRAALEREVGGHAARAAQAGTEAKSAESMRVEIRARISGHERQDAQHEQRVADIAMALAERERQREKIRDEGGLLPREDPAEARARWAARAAERREGAEGQATLAQSERDRAARADEDLRSAIHRVADWKQRSKDLERQLTTGVAECYRIRATAEVQQIEDSEGADLESPGLRDRLLTESARCQRQILDSAAEGAEDQRAHRAIEADGLLPAPADVERSLAILREAGVPAWFGAAWLAQNLPSEQRAPQVVADPAFAFGVVLHDLSSLERAQSLLDTNATRLPVTVALASLKKSTTEGRFVLPGHAGYWDLAAASLLREEIALRSQRRDREHEALRARQQRCETVVWDLDRWLETYGSGRLALLESEQRSAATVLAQATDEQARLEALQTASRAAERVARDAKEALDKEAAEADRWELRLREFVARFEDGLEALRMEREDLLARRAALSEALAAARLDQADAERRRQEAHDAARDAGQAAELARAERDTVHLYDASPQGDVDLAVARARWQELREALAGRLSESRLQWEMDQLDRALEPARVQARKLAHGREEEVAAVPQGEGGRLCEEGARSRREMDMRVGAATNRLDDAKVRLAESQRRRDAADLPDGPPPLTAEEALQRASACRVERDQANQRLTTAQDAEQVWGRQQAAAGLERARCQGLADRLRDAAACEIPARSALPLSAEPAAREAQVHSALQAMREATLRTEQARRAVATHAEAVREIAASLAHEPHRSKVKERLKASAADLSLSVDELLGHVQERLTVVATTLQEIDADRHLVLQAIEKVAMDGVMLLRRAEQASRLPPSLGDWGGEPFLRLKVEVPGTQPERIARLEPLIDRLVDQARIPGGRELVEASVRELAGSRVEATLLKPDAVLRRQRLPVTEMQTFSRGQQLTVAILLYCTLARLRAHARGRRDRADAGVLLLDNPVGTCSSVPLLELQLLVARQMGVQLIYTTGVNDADAIATFPNTVRLRNAHRDRRTGDLHVTEDSNVEGARVVAL